MSTFLQLVNYAREECDAAGSGDLTTLVGVTGESLRFKNWIIRAWNEIQEMRTDWKWMRAAYSFTTTANDGAYSSSDAGIASRFGRFDITNCTVYLTATGTNDQTELEWLDYETFQCTYLIGPQTNQRPTHFTIGDANELLVGPAPDSALYTITGHYFKSPQALSADADEPELPDHHSVIAYRAMKKYARFSASPEIYVDANAEESRMMNAIRNMYLPVISIGESE